MATLARSRPFPGRPGPDPRPERQAGCEDAISVRIAGNRS